VLFVCHHPAPGVRTLLPKWSDENAAVRELGPTKHPPADPDPREAHAVPSALTSPEHSVRCPPDGPRCDASIPAGSSRIIAM
jgi:hypothetical protein